MKTLSQIKDEIAISHNKANWQQAMVLCTTHDDWNEREKLIEEIAELYAQQFKSDSVSKESLHTAPDEWISVETRFPEKFVDVLCVSDKGKIFISCLDASGYFDEYPLAPNETITHWKPLPALPPAPNK